MELSFFIQARPVPQGRARFTAKRGYALVYDPTKSRNWKDYVKWLAMRHIRREGVRMLDGALKGEIAFYLPRPKSLPKKVIHHIKKPDVTNLVKGIEDALNGVFYKDDSQIISLLITKEYAVAEAGVRITVAEVE